MRSFVNSMFLAMSSHLIRTFITSLMLKWMLNSDLQLYIKLEIRQLIDKKLCADVRKYMEHLSKMTFAFLPLGRVTQM